jgi:hypothetical protein
MNPLDMLFGQIRNTISNHSSPNTPGPSYDPSDLLSQLGGLFGQHASQNGQQFDPNANYDNSGQFGNVLSSNQDPYGDPDAQGGYQNTSNSQFGNVLSSNQDPYGDPDAR